VSALPSHRSLPLARPSRAARTSASVLAFVAIVLRSAPALAGDEAAAEALFLEAKRLAAEGKLAEACPKFAESNRLDRGAGTLIHLADCYEKNHQTASAWATFKDAASAAQGLGRADWQKLATQRAAALEPKLAKLTIKVQDPAEKIEVTRDGSATSQASWGTPIPVDVGNHVVAASAPGRKAFKTTVTITKDGDRSEVMVPKLDVDATAGAKTPAVAASSPGTGTRPVDADAGSSDGSAQRTIGLVVGAIGVAGLAVGGVTGLVAMAKNSDSKKACPNDGACVSSDAVDANSSAKTFGTVSTIGFIAGGAAVAVGAVFILSAPSSRPAHAATATKGIRVVPATDGRSAGMSVLGVF
jgi:hypothetical protein